MTASNNTAMDSLKRITSLVHTPEKLETHEKVLKSIKDDMTTILELTLSFTGSKRNELSYDEKTNLNVIDYFKKIEQLIASESNYTLFKYIATKILLVEQPEQLTTEGLKSDYVKFLYAGEFISDQLVINELVEYVSNILSPVLANLNFIGLKNSLNLSAYDDSPIARNTFTMLGFGENMKINNAPLPILIFLLKKIYTSTLATEIPYDLQLAEKTMNNCELVQVWDNKSEIPSGDYWVASFNDHIKKWQTLIKDRIDLVGILSWATFFQSRIVDEEKRVDFMITIRRELNRCVSESRPFNTEIINDMYFRFTVNGPAKLKTSSNTQFFSFDTILESIQKKKRTHEENEETNGTDTKRIKTMNPRETNNVKKERHSTPVQATAPLLVPAKPQHEYPRCEINGYVFLPRGRGIYYNKPYDISIPPHFEWCFDCGMTHRINKHIFAGGQFIGHRNVIPIAINTDRELRKDGYTSD